jgi:hypothetical protein
MATTGDKTPWPTRRNALVSVRVTGATGQRRSATATPLGAEAGPRTPGAVTATAMELPPQRHRRPLVLATCSSLFRLRPSPSRSFPHGMEGAHLSAAHWPVDHQLVHARMIQYNTFVVLVLLIFSSTPMIHRVVHADASAGQRKEQRKEGRLN